MTPEGRLKAAVKRMFRPYRAAGTLHVFMPVQSRWGSRHLDHICCYRGLYLTIETKVGSNHLTPLQEDVREEVDLAGGKSFVVRDDADIAAVKEWLDHGYHDHLTHILHNN